MAPPGSTDGEAQRYDRWLAERRVWRVEDWLQNNAELRHMNVARAFVPAEGPRRVMVEARAQPGSVDPPS